MPDPSFPTPSTPAPPASITHLVRQRTEARAAQDWERADTLKAEIEAEGWRVIDQGLRTRVVPAAPPDEELAGERRYGTASHVPSRLDDPPTAPFSVLLVLSAERGEGAAAIAAALRASAPAGTQLVLVDNDPDAATGFVDPAPEGREGRVDVEIVRTSARLGYAAALNVGLRRAAGEVVVLADGSARPSGDALTPLARALADPEVAAAGAFGLVSRDPEWVRPNTLDRFAASALPAAVPDGGRVAALEGAWLGFRRGDYALLGPFDERFTVPAWLDVWWSLRLRAGPPPAELPEPATPEPLEPVEPAEPEAAGDAGPLPAPDALETDLTPPPPPPARDALLLGLPLDRDETPWPPPPTRLNRRNAYRVLDEYGWWPGLAGAADRDAPELGGSAVDPADEGG